ncbi:mitochondrial 54S ribosomal protein mL59 [Magnusiomyces paraingens]|uniref:Large ribosomal subunit protein mL59 domain-containing protein n=1 Tax=Magnusiomyces paraingens TaxID=2606893 RepID=A0A5E8BKT5_9ASCO|nr:uncharacterized protein SAPINGB_P002236 [Saprochaete ingens]VVT49368.1 unnamed protein product [Saprochaete ingens]
MRISRTLLHEAHEAASVFVAPRLRDRRLASEIKEAAAFISAERVRYNEALTQYNAQVEQQKSTETPESTETSTITPPVATVPLTGNALFATIPAPLANFFRKYPPAPFRQYSKTPTSIDDPTANPFLANTNPITGRIQDSVYSLRRQSDLYKAAYRYGIAHLLPPLQNGKTFYEEKYETKVPVRGASRFKLSIAERKAPARKQEMAEAIAKADEVIAKSRGAKWRRKLEQKNKKPLPWF